MIYKNKMNLPIGAPVEDGVEAIYPSRDKMVGEYCTIEPLDVAAHAKSLFNAFAEDTENMNWTYMIDGPFDSFTEFESWLKSLVKKDDALFYSILNNKNKTAVGLAGYIRINQSHGVIEVGNVHFSPVLQRKPMATESMFLLMQRAFDELGYRRYEWKCDSLNEKSIKAALRLGLTFEGIFRQDLKYKGRNRDTAWYSIIDSEWPRLKRAFVLWLDPSNFDDEGCQRISLKDVLEKDVS